MAAAPSRRIQRQAKKAMIQPALPLIPVAGKKKASNASLGEEEIESTQAAEHDIDTPSRLPNASVNGRSSSSGYGGSSEHLTSTRPESQSDPTEDTQGKLSQTSPIVPESDWNGTHDAMTEKPGTASPKARKPSSGFIQPDVIPHQEPASSTSAYEVGNDNEYPTVATYETWQYGQAGKSEAETGADEKPAVIDMGHETAKEGLRADAADAPYDSQTSVVLGASTDPDTLASKPFDDKKSSDTAESVGSSAGAVNGTAIEARGSSPRSLWPSVTEHLLQLSHNKGMADWVIVVAGGNSTPFATYAHGMILARSPRLRKIMERQPANPQGNVINLSSPMPISPHAFEAALRFLYSDTVLFAENLFPETQPARLNFLPYILSYWVSGLVLGIDLVTDRAMQLLRDFLDWDVLEALMKEAEDLSSGVNKDVLRNVPDWPNAVAQWKTEALSFCAAKINPQDFKLDPHSTSSILQPRFAALEEKPIKPNPALASMVFGSMPSSADLSPTSPSSEVVPMSSSLQDRATSHILVNIDFHDLVFFIQHLRHTWGDSAAKLVTDLVEEREKQRLRTISNRTIPNKRRMANSTVWDTAAYREYLEDGELRRERVSFLLPTKQ